MVNKQPPCGYWNSESDLGLSPPFFAAPAVTFLHAFLAFLAGAVHVNLVCSVLCSNLLECELTSQCMYARTCSCVIRCARCMARCCSVRLGRKLRAQRSLCQEPLHLSHRSTSSFHFSRCAGKSCSLHRSGTRNCRSASRPDGAAPRTLSKLSLSAQATSATTRSLIGRTS